MIASTVTFEKDVIACVMNNQGMLDDIAGIISRNDFSAPPHRIVWDAIVSLHDLKRSFDADSVVHYLTETGRETIADTVPIIVREGSDSVVNIDHKARRIREYSVLRMLLNAGEKIANLAEEHNGRDLSEVLSEAESMLSEVIFGNIADDIEVHDGVSIMREVCNTFERAMQTKGLIGVSTGLSDLDAHTSGMKPGEMIIIAGPPSMGKTAFAINLCQNALRKVKKPVVVFSMEMPAKDIARRMISTASRVPYTAINDGTAEMQDITAIYSTASRLQNPLLRICDSSLLNPAKMRAIMKRISREHDGIALAMVDYVQLMEANKSDRSRTNELSEISRSLKRMAMEFQMPFLVLSQLTKDVEKFKRKPNNGDIRETGQLAQDADMIMFVHRQERYEENPDQDLIGKAEIIITKNRNGPCGSVFVGYDGPTFGFYELHGQNKRGFAA